MGKNSNPQHDLASPGKHALSLQQLRNRIDSIDLSLLSLISERAEVAQQVAKVKQENASSSASPLFYRPEREAVVLRNIMSKNPGPISDQDIGRIFREIMSFCLALEKPIQVAYLGPEGTFTHEASVRHFGLAAHTTPVATIDAVFREVAVGNVDYGVVPVKNSSEGVVSHTLDLFRETSVKIVGETSLSVHHHLVCSKKTATSLEEVQNFRQVCSHPQALGQCRQWLNSHLSDVPRIAVDSTAQAARMILSEENIVGIVSESAVKLYDLQVIAPNIEDSPDNYTRFLVIGTEDVMPSGSDRTSIAIFLQNEPGALHKLLSIFHSAGINLTSIESRPSHRGVWDYVFFIDCEGHSEEKPLADTLKQLSEFTFDVRILGSYPMGVF